MNAETPKVVLVCGGRNFRDKVRLYDVMNGLNSRYGFTTLIHGGASGADTLAGMWAKEWGVSVWVHPADWAKHCNAAGPIRNQDMLERGKPDLVIAFPGGTGTADMVRRAKKTNVQVIEINSTSTAEKKS